MARSMDMVVTDNIDAIVRMMETGPKLAQKYIERPMTINKKKIDLRLVICLKSVN
jgi:tubulin--tyrosine ligase-like protein 12